MTTDPRGGAAQARATTAAAARPAQPDVPRIAVLVVDDHEVVHWGMRTLLRQQPWVERYLAASGPADALALAAAHKPGIALIDVVLGEDSGFSLLDGLRRASPRTRAVFMSGVAQPPSRMLRRLGACGFVAKSWMGQDIAGALRMVALGMTIMEPDGEAAPATLTERERQVLSLMATGATNREIAAALYLSPYTVRDHTSELYRKLHARNRAEAIRRAERLGLTD